MTPERAAPDAGGQLVALFERMSAAVGGLDRLDDLRAAEIALLRGDVNALAIRVEALRRTVTSVERVMQDRTSHLA